MQKALIVGSVILALGSLYGLVMAIIKAIQQDWGVVLEGGVLAVFAGLLSLLLLSASGWYKSVKAGGRE